MCLQLGVTRKCGGLPEADTDSTRRIVLPKVKGCRPASKRLSQAWKSKGRCCGQQLQLRHCPMAGNSRRSPPGRALHLRGSPIISVLRPTHARTCRALAVPGGCDPPDAIQGRPGEPPPRTNVQTARWHVRPDQNEHHPQTGQQRRPSRKPHEIDRQCAGNPRTVPRVDLACHTLRPVTRRAPPT